MSSAEPWERLRADSDPRLHADSVEYVPGTGEAGPTYLVGVVHDHPASVARVRKVVGTLSPDVLALELPSKGVELFESFASDAPTPPPRGGEMSAAIQASPDSRVVGIDAPSRPFVRALESTLRREDLDRDTVSSLTHRAAAITVHAAACWAAVTAERLSLPFPDVVPRMEYSCAHGDPPSVQAEHESGHVRRSRGFLEAVETSASQRRFGTARELAMARRLRELRTDGAVVAVVGFDHLSAITARLEAG
jgi:hypothetical protein